MQGKKFKFIGDAFTACYLAEPEIIEFLNNITFKDDFHYQFQLHRIEGAGMIYDNVIHVLVQNPNDLQYMLFGKLCYSDKRKDIAGNTYVWFYTDNEALYTPFYKDVSILPFLSSITQELGLIENNITTIDIACDSNVNLAKRIKRAILNENILPIVNRKPYNDNREKIKGVRFSYGINQIRLLDVALWIKQNTKDGGFEMKGYDKGEEIEESEKDYITEWLDMKHPYRLEIHLKSEQAQEFFEKSPSLQLAFGNYAKVKPGMLIPALADSNDPLLAQMFYEYSYRLIHFIDKTTGQELSIFDV